MPFDGHPELKAVEKEYKELYEQADAMRKEFLDKPDTKTDEGLEKYDSLVEQLRTKALEVGNLRVLADADKYLNEPEGKAKASGLLPDGEQKINTPGEALVKSEAFKKLTEVGSTDRGRFALSAKVDVNAPQYSKATFTEAASTFTGYDRPPGIVVLGQQVPNIADLFAQGETNQPTIRYQQEDTYTNAAAMKAENTALAEASFDTSEVDSPVQKVGVYAKHTAEVVDDFPQLRDYINNRLVLMCRQRIDAQVYNGNGTPPNISGILDNGGIQTQAKGTDTVMDAIYKGLTLIRFTGFWEPDAMVLHPNDWQDIRLTKDDSDSYYGGGPFSMMLGDMLWGKPVVQSTFATENTALLGAFRFGAQIFYRSGLEVEITNTDQDDFIKNLVTIRVIQRLALAVYRPTAFCTVTGI